VPSLPALRDASTRTLLGCRTSRPKRSQTDLAASIHRAPAITHVHDPESTTRSRFPVQQPPTPRPTLVPCPARAVFLQHCNLATGPPSLIPPRPDTPLDHHSTSPPKTLDPRSDCLAPWSNHKTPRTPPPLGRFILLVLVISISSASCVPG
jgi:hypothetical protein